MSPNLFKKKILTPTKRICFRLKEAREAKGMSLAEMEKKTKITKKYLQALEECRFSDLPVAVVYHQSFVRAYVEALGLNPDSFLNQYLLEEKVKKQVKHPGRIVKQRWFNNLPNFLRLGSIFLVLFIVIFYLGWQVKRIVEPPKLILFSPQEGYITEVPEVLVQGETDREVRVYLNGKEIKNSELGQFKEKVDLASGVNTLTIVAEKKHGKKTTEVRHVVFRS